MGTAAVVIREPMFPEVSPIHGFPRHCLCLSPCPQREGDCKTPEQGMHSGQCVAVVELPQLS